MAQYLQTIVPGNLAQIYVNATPEELARIDPNGFLHNSIQLLHESIEFPQMPFPTNLLGMMNAAAAAPNQQTSAAAQHFQDEGWVGKYHIAPGSLESRRQVGKAARPVNSWMAFRSYYSTLFVSFQQKDISGILRFLWDKDPFKAKWSVAAKAYTLIRDTLGRDKTRLDCFLAVNAPFLGLIGPKEYMTKLGWQHSINEAGQPEIVRPSELDVGQFSTHVVDIGQSVYDIIQHSYEEGIIPPNGGGFSLCRRLNAPAVIAVTQEMLTSAMAQQGAAHIHPQGAVVHPQQEPMGPVEVSLNDDDVAGQDSDAETDDGSMSMDIDSDSSDTSSMVSDLDEGEFDGDELSALETPAADQSDVLQQVPELPVVQEEQDFAGTDFGNPYNGYFEPQGFSDLNFDPFNGEAFDTFDLDVDFSTYFNFDSFDPSLANNSF